MTIQRTIIPKKLQEGDEIRVIAPSRSLGIISKDLRKLAEKNLSEMGLKLSISKNAEEMDMFASSSITSRINDLHEAFADEDVKGILTVIGGFNSNQLLRHLDYDLIRSNPKILCGFSDITALSNAIYAKTGLVGYSGPHYSSFGMKKGLEYTIVQFKKCMFSSDPFQVIPSKQWSDDAWYKDQENRTFFKNDGFFAINEGSAEGTVIGGNLCTFNLLQGTEFMPSLKDTIVFMEDDEESQSHHFDRDLQSLMHQPGFEKVRGLVIGRFQRASEITKEHLVKIIKTKRELSGIPVVAGFDFGHTAPHMTFPVGGNAQIESNKGKAKMTITKH